MLHVALTGNIASGKSAVSTLLAAHGAAILDADLMAREAVAPGSPALADIARHFGAGVLSGDGALDRPALRAVVFSDDAARHALNAIVHPAVAALRAIRLAEAEASGADIVVSDIPLLFETGLDAEFSAIVVVDAPETVRLARLMRDRGLSRDDAEAMMRAQWPAAKKRGAATWVVDNDGSRAQLAERVNALWKALSDTAAAGRRP